MIIFLLPIVALSSHFHQMSQSVKQFSAFLKLCLSLLPTFYNLHNFYQWPLPVWWCQATDERMSVFDMSLQMKLEGLLIAAKDQLNFYAFFFVFEWASDYVPFVLKWWYPLCVQLCKWFQDKLKIYLLQRILHNMFSKLSFYIRNTSIIEKFNFSIPFSIIFRAFGIKSLSA